MTFALITQWRMKPAQVHSEKMIPFVISDIHGCDDELKALQDKVDPGDHVAILAVRDVVDLGLETP